MTETCDTCGRPHARDGCTACGRSKSAPWPTSHVGLGIGKGNAGAARGSPAARRYQICVRFGEAEAQRVKDLATERGHAVGRVVRDLVADGLRYRLGGLAEEQAAQDHQSDEYLARRAAFSTPGNEPQRAAERLRPVHQFGAYSR